MKSYRKLIISAIFRTDVMWAFLVLGDDWKAVTMAVISLCIVLNACFESKYYQKQKFTERVACLCQWTGLILLIFTIAIWMSVHWSPGSEMGRVSDPKLLAISLKLTMIVSTIIIVLRGICLFLSPCASTPLTGKDK
jgi:hypothetical protein